MRHETMTCETFTGLLGAMLEGDLDPAQQAAAEAHAAGCAACASLRSDLVRISAEASELPDLAPSRDLWAGVAARIEPKVLPLATPVIAPPKRWQFSRQALMAAGLVFVTAGVTWFATNQANERALARQVAGAVTSTTAATPDTLGATTSGIDGVAAADPRSGGARPAVPSPTSELGSAPPETQLAVASDPQRPVTTTRPRPTGERRAAGGTTMLASETVPAAARAVEEVYGSEIQRLHDIVAQRKTELDPATVKVIEDNLAIIDSAIVQSRRAIARDPNSGFLMEQLNSVLDRKVGLLRTAAMLPARS